MQIIPTILLITLLSIAPAVAVVFEPVQIHLEDLHDDAYLRITEAVPEPGTVILALLGISAAALFACRRRIVTPC